MPVATDDDGAEWLHITAAAVGKHISWINHQRQAVMASLDRATHLFEELTSWANAQCEALSAYSKAPEALDPQWGQALLTELAVWKVHSIEINRQTAPSLLADVHERHVAAFSALAGAADIYAAFVRLSAQHGASAAADLLRACYEITYTAERPKPASQRGI